MSNKFSFRIGFIYAAIIIVALLLIGKLVVVQIIHGAEFSEKADRQYVSPINSTFDRGVIYFKEKNGTKRTVAGLQFGFTIAINPRVLKNASEVYDALTGLLPELDAETFFFRAGKYDDPYEEIAHRVSAEVADVISNLKIVGVIVQKERWRSYPQGVLGAHLIGFAGHKDNTFGGRYGVERYYDDVLNREEKDLYVNFFAEIFANIEQSLFYKNSREGDIVLSIEPETQRFLESVLEEIMEKVTPDLVGGIIINPQTGSLYAMGVRPTFDPNTYQNEEDFSIFLNPLVESVYEMGSIVKALTMAAGIDSGAVTPETTYNDKGYLLLNGARIENYDGKGRGVVNMQEVLSQSLNTGAAFVADTMGKERLAEYFKDFGFGEETGIDLPNEVPGLISNLDSTRDIEFATASFGQGIAMTPIAMVRALGALANEGVLVTPHVGADLSYTLGLSHTITYGDDKQVIKKSTAETVTRMLVEVVDTALLGGTVKLDNFSIAAKTGTAQIPDTVDGGYYEDRFLHSFFGYFPAYDPKFLIFFYTINPHGVRYASQTLTHPFMDTVKFLINYYNIPPDR